MKKKQVTLISENLNQNTGVGTTKINDINKIISLFFKYKLKYRQKAY